MPKVLIKNLKVGFFRKNKQLRVPLESLSSTYLNFFFHISVFDKNCKCLEELIKIAYDSYKPFLVYFNKLHGKAYQKKLKTTYTED